MGTEIRAGDLVLILRRHCSTEYVGMIATAESSPYLDSHYCRVCGAWFDSGLVVWISLGAVRGVLMRDWLKKIEPLADETAQDRLA